MNSFDGSLLRVPDTPANRAAFGSVGTAGDSAAWPCVRLFPLNNCLTRSLLATFIEYAARDCVTPLEWSRFIVNHYGDEVMEARGSTACAS